MKPFLIATLLWATCFAQQAPIVQEHDDSRFAGPDRRSPTRPRLRNVPISLNNDNWFFIANTGTVALTNDSNGALEFSFPVVNFVAGKDQGSVHYLETTHNGSIAGAMSITVEVITTGHPTFNYELNSDNTCISPANARPIIDTGGDGEFDRWWSNPVAYDLTVGGTLTLTVPLRPHYWSSVLGKFGDQDATTLAGYDQALKNANNVGLTFGGGCFFGHGVSVSGGTAQFKILTFSTF